MVVWIILRPKINHRGESHVRRKLQFLVLIRENSKVQPFGDVITKAALFLLSYLKTLSVGLVGV